MQSIKLHFVCRSNTYRGRLAEAYVNSLKRADIKVSSSGVDADKRPKANISPWAKAIARKYHLELPSQKYQTTEQLLRGNDILVFLSQDVYDDAAAAYKFNPYKAVVWDILNLKDRLAADKILPTEKRKVAAVIEETFHTLQNNIDGLIKELSSQSWVDAVDENNKRLSFKLPVSWFNQPGCPLWYRHSHALITTPNRKIVIRRGPVDRASTRKTLDISLGCSLKPGEKPEQAIVRKIKEELGVDIDPTELQLLDLKKWDHYHPRSHRRSRIFIYDYRVKLTTNKPVFVKKDGPVTLKLASKTRARRLIRYRQLAGFGRLSVRHAYYKRLLKLAKAVD